MSNERKSRLRDILQVLSTEQENDNNEERMNRTTAAVQEVQELLAQGGVEERVRHPGESYLDSRVLRVASDLAISCSLAVDVTENRYDKHELARHIRDNPQFWTFAFPREVPVISSLHGAFDPTPPEQRPRTRKRVERQQAAQLKAPENVESLEKTDEGSEMVTRVNRFIIKAYRNGPISYYRLVLDPTSFSRTVENIYYVSFLVRDGLISVFEDDESGLPFVKPVPALATGNTAGDKNQVIFSIDMQRWRDLIEAFGIEEPMMVIKRIGVTAK
ncbi:EP300-interacting inhibitor of differentiation 3 [Pieris rapae]|uniref:EP300-interacting inhibitor of differentiation 3 n=1 Tax=Pieris rapae TaxID=64459 RepID=UPI001E27AB37|nr:EP300-interacting inhibitor of differentiation 3 [Pieris rapae]